jgi:NTP pyrophosphatase (non-canonical NTP hydrolase)
VDLTEYQRLANNTMGAYVDDTNRRLSVAGMGLAGEAAEVLEIVEAPYTSDFPSKMIKELGDVAWYAAYLATICELDLASIPWSGEPKVKNYHTATLKLCIETGKTCDYLKKVVGHGHTLDVDRVRTQLGRVLFYLDKCCASVHVGVGLAVVCEKNIEKLRVRYPDGFTFEGSINRVEGA